MKAVPKLNLTIPDHTILDKIGEGGMSAVYLGRQISLQRKVAIKVLKKLVMDDTTLAERFVDEAKTVASLDHPHIISIYEAKKLPSGLAYFTMPYLTHGDFGEIICTNSDHLIELLGQICDGLAHAHKHGVIHRDLKPENILFDQFGRIKIADFGIAISKNIKRRTKDTQLLGSAHYMSPEQIQSKEIDHHTDIYSLGCIIYEKLTGDHVFNGTNDFSILMSHINKPIPELPEVLAVWQPIINKCLAKDPSKRFQSVTEVKDALLEIKYNKTKEVPIIAAPSANKLPWYSQFRKPAVLIAAVVVLSCLLAWAFIKLNNNDDNAANLNALNSTTQQNTSIDSTTEAQAADSEPLTMTIAVVEGGVELADEDANENGEMVDLTGNLDNQTINEMSIEVTLNEAHQLLNKYRLTKPKGDNAADKFQSVLLAEPGNQIATNGLNQVGSYYFRLIENKIKDQQYAEAITYTESLVNYLNEYNIDKQLFEAQISQIIMTTDQLITKAISQRRQNPLVNDYLALAHLLKPDYAYLTDLAKNYQAIPLKGDVVNDKLGHQFVFVPSSQSTGLGDMLLGQNEVSVAQFSAFAGEQFTNEKCHHYDKKPFFKKTWAKPPFEQGDNHPVICVSYQNATAYAAWLSQQTGFKYRLPTAQEWQNLNQQIKTNHNCSAANLAGTEVEEENKSTDNPLNCQDQYVFTAPVKSFAGVSNVHDLNGNVAEWVSQCNGNNVCAAGSSWRSGQGVDNNNLRQIQASETHSNVGFRLIREL